MKNDIPTLKNTDRIPRLKVNYRRQDLASFPHVVKLSGGRSSAFMLISLLHHGMLSADRGDVVVFNNTAAEHPETYKFVAVLKKICELQFQVPFFITEFVTYEDTSAGNWVRLPSFKLANSRPKSESNINGYQHKGEVFEELLSHTAFLPNRHRRICTSALKIKVSEQFLSSWFACETELEHLGHFGVDSRTVSYTHLTLPTIYSV